VPLRGDRGAGDRAERVERGPSCDVRGVGPFDGSLPTLLLRSVEGIQLLSSDANADTARCESASIDAADRSPVPLWPLVAVDVDAPAVCSGACHPVPHVLPVLAPRLCTAEARPCDAASVAAATFSLRR
jgi:hypothetical protein